MLLARHEAVGKQRTVMRGLIGGRTASDMPGLDIAEQKSWQNYLNAALRMYAELNARMLRSTNCRWAMCDCCTS